MVDAGARNDGLVAVVIGPGKLGTGLLTLSLADAGVPVHLVARRGSAIGDIREIAVTFADRTERRPVASLSRADGIGDCCRACGMAVEQANELLICISVGTANVRAAAALAEEMAARRPARRTFVVFAENDPGQHIDAVTDRLSRAGAQVMRSMVNRVCRKVRDHGTTRYVEADETAEWVISPDHVPSAILDQLARQPHVARVGLAEQAQLERRKLSLVNGGHLALAMQALQGHCPSIADATRNPGWMAPVHLLHQEMVSALSTRHPDLDTVEALRYAGRQIAVWSRSEDDGETLRIMRRLHRHDLVPLINDVRLKLGATAVCLPGGVAAHDGHRLTFEALHRLLVSPATYPNDEKEFGGALERDASRDASAVSAYGQLLQSAYRGGLTPLSDAAAVLCMEPEEVVRRVGPVSALASGIVVSDAAVSWLADMQEETSSSHELDQLVRDNHELVSQLRDASRRVAVMQSEFADALDRDRRRHR